MNWIISLGITFIIVFLVVPYFVGIHKDNNDLRGQTIAEKFKFTIDILNLAAFNRLGEVIITSKKTFSLYLDNHNQIINCDYYFGHLTIIWKFKYSDSEIVHQKIFHDLRKLSLYEQQKIAEEMINEMAIVMENHKNDILKHQGIGLSPVNVSNRIATHNNNSKSQKDVQLPVFSTFTDSRDGKVYKTVKIGNQVWMAENLRYIPHVCPASEDGGIWVYNYNGYDIQEAITTNYYKKYGCLYNWETAKTVCPENWHLSTDDEWTLLIYSLGGEDLAGSKLKSPNGWQKSNTSEANESGFSAIPGGSRKLDANFSNVGIKGSWWSSAEGDGGIALYRYTDSTGNNVVRAAHYKRNGVSVRCVRNN